MEISLEQYNKMAERLTELGCLLAERHWIPCSERLPENDCQCIVTAKVKHVDGYPDYEVDTADYTDGIFTTANSWWGIESIIAWMPLPEGYRGGQDGNQREKNEDSYRELF